MKRINNFKIKTNSGIEIIKFAYIDEMLIDNNPKDLSYCIVIYARDPNSKSERRPDGDIRFNVLSKTTMYDDATIKEYLTTEFKNL